MYYDLVGWRNTKKHCLVWSIFLCTCTWRCFCLSCRFLETKTDQITKYSGDVETTDDQTIHQTFFCLLHVLCLLNNIHLLPGCCLSSLVPDLTSERLTTFVFLAIVWSRIPAICAAEEWHRQLPGVLPAAAESAPHSRCWCATGLRWRPRRPASHQQRWQLPQSAVFRQSSAEDYHPEER